MQAHMAKDVYKNNTLRALLIDLFAVLRVIEADRRWKGRVTLCSVLRNGRVGARAPLDTVCMTRCCLSTSHRLTASVGMYACSANMMNFREPMYLRPCDAGLGNGIGAVKHY